MSIVYGRVADQNEAALRRTLRVSAMDRLADEE
jgi:hypothetical protein